MLFNNGQILACIFECIVRRLLSGSLNVCNNCFLVVTYLQDFLLGSRMYQYVLCDVGILVPRFSVHVKKRFIAYFNDLNKCSLQIFAQILAGSPFQTTRNE